MDKYKGQWCIVRTDHKAAFFGKLAEVAGDKVTMAEARRLWHWSGTAGVAQLASEGPGNPEGCRFEKAAPEMVILGVREVLPVEEEAAEKIRAVKDWTIDNSWKRQKDCPEE